MTEDRRNYDKIVDELKRTNDDLKLHYEEDRTRHEHDDLINSQYREQEKRNTEIIKSIPEMKRMMEDYIREDKREWAEFIKSDTAWKLSATPVVQAWNHMSGTAKLLVLISAGIIAIGGAFTVIKNIFK